MMMIIGHHLAPLQEALKDRAKEVLQLLLEQLQRKSLVMKSIVTSSSVLMHSALVEVQAVSTKVPSKKKCEQLKLMLKGCNTMNCSGKMKD